MLLKVKKRTKKKLKIKHKVYKLKKRGRGFSNIAFDSIDG